MTPPPVPAWAVLSAWTAPVALIGAWTLAAANQQEPFDAVRETISALAATTADPAWIMTVGLALTGVAHLTTALALRPVRRRARVVYAVGGAATLAVAALPVDVWPAAHGAVAGVAFVALSVWPALAARPGGPGVLRPLVARAAAVVLGMLLVVFVVELQGLPPGGGAATGSTERLVAGAQALWPLVVVLDLRSRMRRDGRPEDLRVFGGAARR
jgi:hypothetical membrane protein